MGSFCGFDFTNLGQGALLGEKLICPTCGSNYDINSGFAETGPNMRNLSMFPIKSRGGEIDLTVPEHIPAFSKKKFLKRESIDPRTYIVLGDNETALATIDALRTNFTGRIIMMPQSGFGAFENTDVMKRDFSPLSKNQCYLVENDYLDRANIDIIKGGVKYIDVDNRKILVNGYRKPIPFDKIIVAWGADRNKLKQSYSNVHYIEDRFSHAKVHNDLLKAKDVLILGNTFEAFQMAQTTRTYLDEIGQYETKVVLMTTGDDCELKLTLGNGMEAWMQNELAE